MSAIFDWPPYLLGAILNVGNIWFLVSKLYGIYCLLCVKLLSWILYFIRITVLLCVIGDRYKKSNHQCLITYTCRTLLCGLWSMWRYSDFICNYGGIVRQLSTKRWTCSYDILTKTAVFIPDARPVFSMNMCGTAPSGLKPSAKRRGMIIFKCNVIVIMFAVRYGCVMNVLWMCYECVMNVLWMCYESVMRVLWERYESVMKVLWKCYGCVMGVLWVCEVCYGCVRYVMDVWGMLWTC